MNLFATFYSYFYEVAQKSFQVTKISSKTRDFASRAVNVQANLSHILGRFDVPFLFRTSA